MNMRMNFHFYGKDDIILQRTEELLPVLMFYDRHCREVPKEI